MHITITTNLAGIYKFLDRIEAIVDGRNEAVMEALGRHAVREIKSFFDRGGSDGAPGGKRWDPTSPYWVKARGKGHNRPLIHTYAMRNSITAINQAGPVVRVGSPHPGARRHHFGDRSPRIGRPQGWRFALPVNEQGVIVASGTRMKVFQPVIKARPFLTVSQHGTVDPWMAFDVRRALDV